ncbi:hypothetical protein QBC43DRAFT_324062 [Cladorrhinum sp. PSN259]|nr:hypothetical protein QBC43DRAFT_324062 [Cladorrhinum sp. PSN259]
MMQCNGAQQVCTCMHSTGYPIVLLLLTPSTIFSCTSSLPPFLILCGAPDFLVLPFSSFFPFLFSLCRVTVTLSRSVRSCRFLRFPASFLFLLLSCNGMLWRLWCCL